MTNNEFDAVDYSDEASSDEVLPQGAHANFMGAASYPLGSPLTALQIMASSSFFGEPTYYGAPTAKRFVSSTEAFLPTRDSIKIVEKSLGKTCTPRFKGTSAEQMSAAIDAALDCDPEGTLQIAVKLRQMDHIRTTPQVILVRAAKHPKVRGTDLIRRYAPFITARPDEPMVQKAYHDAVYGEKSYPNSLKKFWASYLEGLSPFAAAKYRNKVKGHPMVDLVNLTHPRSNDTLTKLVKGELTLPETSTWESLISSKGSNAQTWAEAIPVMNHMALLRNLRNFVQNNVDPALYLERLVQTAETGKQLPFRYISAYKAVDGADSRLVNALDECLKISMKFLPYFKGRTMSLSDNSGSAHGATTSSLGKMTVAEIGNLSALFAALASDEGHVGVFGDTLKVTDLSKGVPSILKAHAKIQEVGETVGGNTENGIWLFWRDAIRQKQHWDNVFVYSDMQCGHGGLYGVDPQDYREFIWNCYSRISSHIDVPKLIQKYRETVNPRVNVYLVQIAGYSDTVIPEVYDRTFILGGWGDGILRYAHQMSTIFDGSAASQ